MPGVATLVIVGVMLALLIAVSRRVYMPVVFTAYLLSAIVVCSTVKHSLLGAPLTLADVRFFVMQPAENSKLFFNYPMLGIALLAVIAGGVLIVWLGLRFERASRLFTWPRGGRFVRFGTIAACAATVIVGYFGVSSSSHAARADNGDAWAAFFALRDMEQPDGFVGRLNVFFDNRDTLATLPPAHAQSRFVRQIAVAAAPTTLPDILMVLEESTFDPTLAAKCTFPECHPAMFEGGAPAQRVQQGPLLVHTTGGGTWLSEFSFLSGFDWRTFGRGGAYAPVSLAPRLTTSLAKHLQSLGYRTVAICPTEGNFLNARSAYRYYGFDEFYSAEDFKFTNDWHTVPDTRVFENALDYIGRRQDSRPVFAFVLTIRNHGPHGEEPDKIPVAYRPLRAPLSDGLADYLARLKDSSDAFQQVRTSWLQSSRPRVIGWFGDHQPEVAWSFIEHPTDVNQERLAHNVPPDLETYLTYYQLSANFDGMSRGVSHDATDIVYLGMRTLEFAGLPLDAGQSAASQVDAKCNGLLYDCKDSALIDDYLSYRIHDLHGVQ
jgi:Sulfatase